jgi:hypothetical protein
MVEFGIAHEPLKVGEEWQVIGRCVTDIHVGSRFTKFVPHHKRGGGEAGSEYVCDDAVPVDLTIVRILAYGKELETWSAGLTAKLVLLGSGDNLGAFGSLCG